MTKSKRISHSKYIQAVGLFTMAARHYAKSREFEIELSKHLAYGQDYMGCISDAIYTPSEFDEALAKEGYTVTPSKAKRRN